MNILLLLLIWGGICGLSFFCLRSQNRYSFLLLTIPLLTLLFSGPWIFQEIGIHKMIYAGISELIRTQGIPPENPYFAGHTLHYPWGGILFHTFWRSILSMTYGQTASLCVGIAYILFWITSFKLSSTLYRNSSTAKFALILAIIAPTWLGPVVGGFQILGEAARSITPALIFERYDQWPLAFTISIIALLLVVQGFKNELSFIKLCAISLSVAAAIFLYPFCLLFLLPFIGAVAYLIRKEERKRNLLVLSLIIGIALITPYLFLSTAGRSKEGAFYLDLNLKTVLFQLRDFVFIAIIPLYLIPWRLWQKTILMKSSIKNGIPIRFLLLSTIPCIGLILFVHFPGLTHYKLRVMTLFLLCLVAAPYFRAFYKRWKWQAIILLIILHFPYSIEIYRDWYGNLRVQNTYRFHSGDHGRATQLEEQTQQAYDWIIQNTPKNSVWIDFENAYLPAYTGRALYVAQTPSRESLLGWTMKAHFFLEDTCGIARSEIDERIEQVTLLAEIQTPSELKEPIVLQIKNQIQNRSLYLIQSSDKSELNPVGNKVFENQRFKIFEVGAEIR